jgi:hypothetical protein
MWAVNLAKSLFFAGIKRGGDDVSVCAIRSNILSVEERAVGKYSEGNICIFLRASAILQNSLFFLRLRGVFRIGN